MNPILLTPILKDYIWGGTRLHEMYGKGGEGIVAESWEISCHPDGVSLIDGVNFAEYIRENPDVIGSDRLSDEFPVLIKFIDAAKNLSVQVHPDDAYAGVNENGSLGKTECWYVLDCDEGATIIIGHNAASREEMAEMVEQDRWNELLRQVPIHKGDFFTAGNTLCAFPGCPMGKDFGEDGEKGEIVIKGENVMAGYWKNPESTAETVRDGYLYTGDLGYMSKEGLLYVKGRFKSLLISSDGEKYSPEGIEEALVEKSPFIDQVMLYNNQCTTTTALIVPNKDALRRYIKDNGLKAESEEGRKAALQKLESELARFKKGGEFQGMFPERWLPSAFAVLAEPFTEQNQMINSTMKMVRPKIEKAYKERIDYMYSSEGKQTLNPQNMEAVL